MKELEKQQKESEPLLKARRQQAKEDFIKKHSKQIEFLKKGNFEMDITFTTIGKITIL
ncbi:MAG: hypothetical protein AAFO15_01150 [Pseudomonadota bacterium]